MQARDPGVRRSGERLMIVPLIAFLVVIALLAQGQHLPAGLLYGAMGLGWVLGERSQPTLHRPMGYATPIGSLLLFAVWPMRVLMTIGRDRNARSTEGRFAVGSSERIVSTHGSWDEALSAAKATAAWRRERTLVIDRATTAKVFGEWSYQTWFIDENGDVSQAPSKSPFR